MWNSKGGRRSILTLAVLALSSGSGLAAMQAHAASAGAQESNVDPGAKDALLHMSDYLRSLQAYSIHESVTREQVINGDLKVQKSLVADIGVRRPDRLKAEVLGDDDKNHTIYYDGKTVTVYLPAHNYYVQMDAPGTVGSALDTAEARYGIEFPTSDFLRMNSRDALANGLKAAGYVGPSRVDGIDCDHYAYRTADVDYQVWFEKGDKPLPRKLVITSKKDQAQPEYTAVMTWDVSPKLQDATFEFTPPQGATRIAFGTAIRGRSGQANRHPNPPKPPTSPSK